MPAIHFRLELPLAIDDLARFFNPSAAHDLAASYGINLVEANGELTSWTVTIGDGSCHVEPHLAEDPDVVFTLDVAALQELVFGQHDVATLYQTRRLKLNGNLDLAIRFPRLFCLPVGS